MELQEELFVQGLGVMQNHAQKNHMKWNLRIYSNM